MTLRLRRDEDFLLKTLDTDDGARVLGEFGIGCNPGIQRHTQNTLFDEKIEGTIHLALGNGFPFIGGTNVERRPLGHGQEPAERGHDRDRRRGRAARRQLVDLMRDPRIEAYAKLLVERCLDVQPGWEVLIRSTPLARPLLEELERQIARRGAYAIMRVNWSMWPIDDGWAAEAPEDLLGELPEIDRYSCDRMDARITLDAPENTRAAADLSAERLALAQTRPRRCSTAAR